MITTVIRVADDYLDQTLGEATVLKGFELIHLSVCEWYKNGGVNGHPVTFTPVAWLLIYKVRA